ncbi:MAG: PTS transporter subunit EIIC, partial [Nocardioidaceae bacterium]
MSAAEPTGDRTRPPSSSPPAARVGLGVLQRLGRSLMLPIAALPVAALLLRLGQPDMLGAGDTGLALANRWGWLEPVAAVLAAAGGTLFSHLGLLFAVGVAIGFARKADGSTALAAVVGYLVFDGVTDAMTPYVLPKDEVAAGAEVNYVVFGGILVGVTTALLWQRFYRIKLPPYLAFFGGRRFVPILTALVTLV